MESWFMFLVSCTIIHYKSKLISSLKHQTEATSIHKTYNQQHQTSCHTAARREPTSTEAAQRFWCTMGRPPTQQISSHQIRTEQQPPSASTHNQSNIDFRLICLGASTYRWNFVKISTKFSFVIWTTKFFSILQIKCTSTIISR